LAKQKLGEDFFRIVQSSRESSQYLYVRWLIDRLEAALLTGKTSPGWQFTLASNDQGHVKFRTRSETSDLFKRVSFDLLTDREKILLTKTTFPEARQTKR